MTEIRKDKGFLDKSQSMKDIRIYIIPNICTGCGLCGELCPFGLPKSNDSGKFEIKEPESCIECSACQRNCPVQAIIMQEQKGCGCLWDARQRLKNDKSGKVALNSCGCGPVSTSTCCGEPATNDNFDIKIIESFNSFIKPTLNSCCAPSKEPSKKSETKEK